MQPASPLSPYLLDRVLNRLDLPAHPDATPATLRTLYANWCQRVPFDNVQKLIHVRNQRPGPLPGSEAVNFFEAWLQHGAGGTCWAGSTALMALLQAIGFEAERGIATMLVAPDIPPNHATVRVRFENEHYLVDTSMLFHEPLRLREDRETLVPHPAWGLQCAVNEGRWSLHWRPLHQPKGFECRIESFGATQEDYLRYYDQTRAWSPFNYQLYARINRGESVTGIAFGQAVTLSQYGGAIVRPVEGEAERRRLLVEVFGMSEEIVNQLPEDVPTPPPPGSRTAMVMTEAMAA